MPQAALATDTSFTNAAEFQTKLQEIISSGSGASTLTYTGTSPAGMTINGTVVAPGTPISLIIDLGESLTVGATADGSLTLGEGVTLNVGKNGEPTLSLGATDTHGTLNLSGGVVNIGKTGKNAAFLVGFGAGQEGTLNITNGGVLNLGSESGGAYSQLFAGYEAGANATILIDDGRINVGEKGASIRLGMGGTTTFTMRNGSVLDSTQYGSHLWIGDGATGTATFTLDDSTILNTGGGGKEDRYFFVGRASGNGTFTQTGDKSRVELSGMSLIGIGQGKGGKGTYNLNGGVLQVGNDTFKDAFRVGVDFEGDVNGSTATFNINGGTADLRGNLEIANGGLSTGTTKATVNLNAGLLDVGGKIVFGSGTRSGTLNLNAGVLKLGGSNAITGPGSIFFDGGTLSAKSDLTIAHAATLKAGGAVFDTNGFSTTYSGVLSGVGGVEKTGAGTFTMSGVNTFTGGVTVKGGTLETKNAAALGTGNDITLDGGTLKLSTVPDLTGDVTVGDNDGTIDVAGNTAKLDGDVTGSGDLTIQNGTLQLGGTMDLTGATKIGADGTLETTAANQLSAGSILDIAASGTLSNLTHNQAVAGITGSGTISNGATITVGGTDATSTFSGALNGSGSLEKMGTGTFTLGGNGSMSGSLLANGGLLVVNGNLSGANVVIGASGKLGGTGTVNNVSGNGTGGIIAPGNSFGTINIAGNLEADGLTYELELDATGNTDLIEVTGTAELDGGSLDVKATPGVYSTTPYLILTATGGVTGEFEVDDNLAFYTAIADYTQPDEVWLQILRNSVTLMDVAETPNQAEVADALERLGDGNPIYDAILQSDEDDVGDALDSLSGEIHASTKTALIEDSRHIRDAANDRLRLPTPSEGTDVWARAFGALGSIGSDGNAAAMQRGLGGVVIGADTAMSGIRAGLLGGYSQSSLSIDDRASTASADSYHLGAYAGTQFDGLNLRGGIAYSLSSIETDRTVTLPGLTEALSAGYFGSTLQAFGEVGYTVDAGVAAFEPFINLAHVRLDTAGYSETGGDTALTGAGGVVDATLATLGLRVAGDFVVNDTTTITARGSAAWRSALGSTAPTSTHAIDGEEFTVAGSPLASDALLFEAGLDVALSEMAKLSLSYNGQIAAGQADHSGRVGLAVKF